MVSSLENASNGHHERLQIQIDQKGFRCGTYKEIAIMHGRIPAGKSNDYYHAGGSCINLFDFEESNLNGLKGRESHPKKERR